MIKLLNIKYVRIIKNKIFNLLFLKWKNLSLNKTIAEKIINSRINLNAACPKTNEGIIKKYKILK